jgi:hypothetical protein
MQVARDHFELVLNGSEKLMSHESAKNCISYSKNFGKFHKKNFYQKCNFGVCNRLKPCIVRISRKESHQRPSIENVVIPPVDRQNVGKSLGEG